MSMTEPGVLLTLAVTSLIFCALMRTRTCRTRPGLRSPRGPRGIPLLGSLFSIPAVDSHIAYFNMARTYGPIFTFKALNRPFVVVSDMKIAVDLLDKRGAIYSARPPTAMSDASGYGWNLASMPPNQHWRQMRRLLYQQFNANSTMRMRSLIRRSTLELARNLVRSPQHFRDHLQRQSAASLMRSVYGIRIAEEHDPYVTIVRRAVDGFSKIIVPGSTPVDMFPFLLRIPAWIPVLGYWTKHAQSLREYPQDMIEIPYARAKDDIRQGIASRCMVSEDLELMHDDPTISETTIKHACAMAYFAGADTSVSVLLAFVLAMVLFPDHQNRAQDELDRVLGERLPDFDDAPSLPYVEAIIRETYRAYTVTPLTFPRVAEQDDVYEGFFIRKGTTVIPNLWAMMHDEKMFEDPYVFNPKRWITENGVIDPQTPDPRVCGAFGFGRRICPGRYFGDASVFITVATLLKCFNFAVQVEHGIEKPPSGKIETGILSCPAPFKCSILPRSNAIQALLETALEACED